MRGVAQKPEARSEARFGLAAAALLVTLTSAGCPNKTKPAPDPSVKDAVGSARPSASGNAAPVETGNAERGKVLALRYECNRCHEGTGYASAPQAKHCVSCHKDIMEDRFQASAPSIARWKPRVKELADAPSLDAMGKRMTRRWVEQYLLQPIDLRPQLQQSMPRLAISAEDARDLAAYLVPEADASPADLSKAPEIAGADLGKGRQLLETKGCGSCHTMTGVLAIPGSSPPDMDSKAYDRARRLAPDLVFARARMTPARLVAWMKDPVAVKKDSAMPRVPLSDAEVKSIVAYILTAELSPPPAKARPVRLPVLTRKVAFKEVDEKVFHRTCWHCHSEPDYAIGDGGPGNSGGLGFKARGMNLSSYEGIAAGYVDDKDERQSAFAKDAEGVPRLVRALLARHDEEAGAATGEVRGMPLGYAPLPLEEIQLIETWIAQGRPR